MLTLGFEPTTFFQKMLTSDFEPTTFFQKMLILEFELVSCGQKMLTSEFEHATFCQKMLIGIWTHNFFPENAHIWIWTHTFFPINALVGIEDLLWTKIGTLTQCGSCGYFCITFLGDFRNYGKVFWLAHVNYHVWIESSRQITINFSGLLLDENGEFLLNYIIAASVHLVESRSLLSRNAHFSTSNQCHALFFTTS